LTSVPASGDATAPVIRRALHYAPAAAAALGLLAYGSIYAWHLSDRPIRSDGVSYYEYLPAWIADGDPTFETLALDCCAGYDVEEPVGIHRRPESGRWLAVHPMGVAVLMLPFFLVAHVLSWWSNLPRDGFSLYYQYIVGAAGLAYFVAGLVVLRRVLRLHFGDGVVLATLVAITFGTNLFHYAVFDSTFSHAFSFFLIASLLLLVEDWWTAPTLRRSIALGVVSGLIVLVRHTNGVFLAIVPCYGVSRWSDLAANGARLWHRRRLVMVTMAAAGVCVLPQLLVYKWASGHWIVNSYPEGSFSFAAPHLVGTMFSVERGLFFWSPVLLLAIPGMFVATGWARGLVAPTVGVLAIVTYLMASWFMWDLGAGFGHRGYTDALSLFAVYLASVFAWTARRPRLAPWVAGAVVLLVALSTFQMWQYWNGLVPMEHTTWTQYRAAFLRLR